MAKTQGTRQPPLRQFCRQHMGRWNRPGILAYEGVPSPELDMARIRRRLVVAKLRELAAKTVGILCGTGLVILAGFYAFALLLQLGQAGGADRQPSLVEVLAWARDLRGGWSSSTLLIGPTAALLPAILTVIVASRSSRSEKVEKTPEAQAVRDMLGLVIRSILLCCCALGLLTLVPPDYGVSVPEVLLAIPLAISSAALATLILASESQVELGLREAGHVTEVANIKIKELRRDIERKYGRLVSSSHLAAAVVATFTAWFAIAAASASILLFVNRTNAPGILAAAILLASTIGIPTMFTRSAWLRSRGLEKLTNGVLLTLLIFLALNMAALLGLSLGSDVSSPWLALALILAGALTPAALGWWFAQRGMWAELLEYSALLHAKDNAERRIRLLKTGSA